MYPDHFDVPRLAVWQHFCQLWESELGASKVRNKWLVFPSFSEKLHWLPPRGGMFCLREDPEPTTIGCIYMTFERNMHISEPCEFSCVICTQRPSGYFIINSEYKKQLNIYVWCISKDFVVSTLRQIMMPSALTLLGLICVDWSLMGTSTLHQRQGFCILETMRKRNLFGDTCLMGKWTLQPFPCYALGNIYEQISEDSLFVPVRSNENPCQWKGESHTYEDLRWLFFGMRKN